MSAHLGSDRPIETVSQAREEIDRTREQLGETVSALAEKTDVKAQVRRKFDETRSRISQKTASLQASGSGAGGNDPMALVRQLSDRVFGAARANPPVALAVTLLLGWLVGRVTKRRRSS